jgi:hypothetical protein
MMSATESSADDRKKVGLIGYPPLRHRVEVAAVNRSISFGSFDVRTGFGCDGRHLAEIVDLPPQPGMSSGNGLRLVRDTNAAETLRVRCLLRGLLEEFLRPTLQCA